MFWRRKKTIDPLQVGKQADSKAAELRGLAKQARKEQNFTESLRLQLIAGWYGRVSHAIAGLEVRVSPKSNLLDPPPTGWKRLKLARPVGSEIEKRYRRFFLDHLPVLKRVSKAYRQVEGSAAFINAPHVPGEKYRDRLYRLLSKKKGYLDDCRYLSEQGIEKYVDQQIMPLLNEDR